jgi:lipoyl(octanoyl) transferase
MRALIECLTLIVDPPAPGERNMQKDEALLDACASGRSPGAIRMYGFSPPCLTLGRLQPRSDVDVAQCARLGVDVVRRPTGGRAVLHDQEVTYAVVCRIDDPDLGGDVLTSCARIHRVIADGLARLSVATHPVTAPTDLRGHARALARIADCFARPAAHEILDERGRKLVGSAQARRGAALLQHGAVPLEPPAAHQVLCGASPPGTASPGVRGVIQRPVSATELRDALIDAFTGALGDRLRTA